MINHTYEITPYNENSGYNLKAIGQNTSTIIDKLIRLAAKLTENYASDIIYDITNFKDSVKNSRVFSRVLSFHEYGIITYPINVDNEVEYASELESTYSYPQYWELSYDSKYEVQTLRRVRLREKKSN